MPLHGSAPTVTLEASYLIFINPSDGLVKAKNGLTGVIDFSGSDAATVIQAAINASDGTMMLKGDLGTLSVPLTLPSGRSNLIFEGNGRNKTRITAPLNQRAFNFVGVLTQRFIVFRDMTVISNGPTDALYFEGVNGVYMVNVEVDGGGISFKNVTGIQLLNVLVWCFRTPSRANIRGLTFNGCTDVEVLVAVISGMGCDGIFLLDSSGRFIGCEVSNNGIISSSVSRHGINIYNSPNVLIHSSTIFENYGHGIFFYADAVGAHTCDSGIVTDNHILRNSKASAGAYDGVRVTGDAIISNILIGRNQIYDDAAPKTQAYGVTTLGLAVNTSIIDNIVDGNLTGGISTVGTGNIIRFNRGFVTENNGTSIGTGAQQTIPHGCNFTPTYDQVFLSERSTGLAVPYQSAPPDAINIYVTATLNKTYNWRVSMNP